MIVPDRTPRIWGYLKPAHTMQGIHISARTGLAYGEIAKGTSGRQKTWHSCALYHPALTDHAYHRPFETEYLGNWDIVGIIKPTVHRPGQFVMHLHRWFNPQPNLSAKITMSDPIEARELMQHILEKWYV